MVLAAAGGASAHVTVHSADAKPGGSGTLVFKVPNEESNAQTTKVEIDLPTDTPLSDVTTQAPSGWQASVTGTQIVFSGGTISGDDDQEFPVKVGKLPNSDKVVFKAIQTYSNGDVVRWIEQSAEGAPEPAHPAPTLNLKNPSALSEDEIQDAKEDAEKKAGDAKAGSSDSKSNDMGGMDMSKMSAADMAAMGSGSSSSSASPSASATPSATAMSSSGSSSSGSSTPTTVHAGTGGQAAGAHGVPVAPVPFVLAGLAVAAYGARRLLRG